MQRAAEGMLKLYCSGYADFLLLPLCYTTGGSFSKLKSRFRSREWLAERLIPEVNCKLQQKLFQSVKLYEEKD
jgi:hypothetical protein